MKNSLRTYRKKTEITIDDVSRLLSMQDSSTISRIERGLRKPSLEIIFTYHLLFDVECENVFEDEIKEIAQRIHVNIPVLVDELSQESLTDKVIARINYLNSLKESIKKKI